MVTEGVLDALARRRALAIVRGRDPDASLAAIEALIEEGVSVIEVSLTGTDALSVMRRAAERFSGSALLGAGTVRTPEQLDAALEAGAAFVVGPALTSGTLEALLRGVPALPGVFSASELDSALDLGARMVKLFPASVGGPAYVRALREPYPDAAIVPVGGVSLESVPDYLNAGAVAVGLGSPLLGDAPHGGSLEGLRERARSLVATIPRSGNALRRDRTGARRRR